MTSRFLTFHKVKCSMRLHWETVVDYLPMAKPVAANQLGIRHDCAKHLHAEPVVGCSQQGSLTAVATSATVIDEFKICEAGEQGGFGYLSLAALSRSSASNRWF